MAELKKKYSCTRRSSSTGATSFDREMLVEMGFDYYGIGR